MPRRKRAAGGSRRPQKSKPQAEDPGLSLDAVDEFHEERQQILLGGEPGESSSDESLLEQPVFGLSSDSESDDEPAEAEGTTAQWGTTKNKFYDADTTHLNIEFNEEDAADEEEEALRLQKLQAEGLDEQDFQDSASSSSEEDDSLAAVVAGKKKGKKGSAKSDADGPALGMTAGEASLAVERVSRNVSAMSRDEKLRVIAADSPELLGLLAEFQEKADELRSTMLPLYTKLRGSGKQVKRRADASALGDGDCMPTAAGVSYLEVKFHLLLSYCTNVAFYLLLKTRGKRVRDHPVMASLLRLRTLMERLRPLDGKLRYQVTRLLNTANKVGAASAPAPSSAAAATGPAAGAPKGGSDPHAFAPRLSNLVAPDAGVGSGSEDEAEDRIVDGRYRVGKRVSVSFDEAQKREARAEKKAARKAARAQRSTLLADMQQEFSARPEEIAAPQSGSKEQDEEDEERREYEEKYLMRLPVTRKDKQRRAAREREASHWTSVADVGDDFGELQELGGSDGEDLTGTTQEDRDWLQRRRALARQVNRVEQKQARKGRTRLTGDENVPFADPSRQQPVRRASVVGTGGDVEDDGMADYFGGGGGKKKGGKKKGGVEQLLVEDPFYTATASEQKVRKREREAVYEREPQLVGDADATDGKRGPGWNILNNPGLRPHKKKEYRNPRKKKRIQYERAKKRRKGQVRPMRVGENDRYGGEVSGIRKGISRSRRITN